ncbi:hypothetical protein ACH4S8_27060 [Streptomyces sp. NPDC021080]|uniref:hypothetical protein n=1 Tax=Streptomyces sp. NPDC021080 TaxID=3365110 RepID=UPI0037B3F067
MVIGPGPSRHDRCTADRPYVAVRHRQAPRTRRAERLWPPAAGTSSAGTVLPSLGAVIPSPTALAGAQRAGDLIAERLP